MQGYLFLAAAIGLETVGTAFLKLSDGFTRLGYSAGVAISYLGAFYLLSLTIRTLSVGTAYAIWAGVGVALAQAVSYLFFKEPLTWTMVGGIVLIIAGVAILHVGGAAH